MIRRITFCILMIVCCGLCDTGEAAQRHPRRDTAPALSPQDVQNLIITLCLNKGKFAHATTEARDAGALASDIMTMPWFRNKSVEQQAIFLPIVLGVYARTWETPHEAQRRVETHCLKVLAHR